MMINSSRLVQGVRLKKVYTSAHLSINKRILRQADGIGNIKHRSCKQVTIDGINETK
jgi:hypothetical protein